MTTETDELLYEISDGIGTVTFNRPRQRNAFTFAMYYRLAEICRETPTDGSIKAIILHGGGDKAFAAGTDIGQFRDFSTARDALDYEAKIGKVIQDIELCPVPTIAAINGACTGGGAGIAAACDLRIAAKDMKFGFPIARTLGNCLSVDSLTRLTALLGFARTRELLLTARLVEAEEALAIGLVSEVVADQAAVLARARELAQTLGQHAPITMRVTKEALRRMLEAQPRVREEDLIEAAYTSADFREGMTAFLEKRKPNWTGK